MAATLSTWLDERAVADADALALVDRGRETSWAALALTARSIASGLARAGVGPGDRVALWMPNVPAWLATFFACARLGAIVVSVNTRFRTHELEDIVGRSGAVALVFWPGFRGIDFNGIVQACDPAKLVRLRTIIAYAEGEPLPAAVLGRPIVAFGAVAASEPMVADHATPDAGCILFTTSGTTRAPKFVLHDHRTIIAHAEDVATAFGYHLPDTKTLATVPLSGVFGFNNALATIAARRPLVLMPTFDGTSAAGLVQLHGITHAHATDDMIEAMLAAAPGERPFPSLRFCGFAAFSPAQADLPVRAAARGVTLVGLYGSSEIQALYAIRAADAPDAERALAGGRPVSPMARVRATDPESRAILPHGTPGELEFTGPSVMRGYFEDPGATRAAFSADGFFRSGDLGHTTADGQFVFVQRLGDALRLAGFLVSPAEIEDVLRTLPGVTGAQVVGAHTPRGVQPVAFVTLEAGARFDEAAAMAHCAGRIARFKVPVRIVVIDAFPFTPSANGSKIQRHRLREMAEALLDGTDATA